MIIMVINVQVNHTLIAYYCMGKGLNTTTISLESVEECRMSNERVTETEETIQLVQLIDEYPMYVFQCKVVITRLVAHCGMHSHSSIVKGGLMRYIKEIPKSLCEEIHKTGRYEYDRTNIINDLRLNGTTTRSTVFAGSVTDTGSCSGAWYSDQFGEWSDVVVQGSIEITLNDYTAFVHSSTGTIKLRNGLTCHTSRIGCMDIEHGNTFWDIPRTGKCDDTNHMVLYEGVSTKHLVMDNGREKITYSVTTKDKSFGLTITDAYNACAFTSYRTEHPKLIIIPKGRGRFFFSKGETDSRMLDLMAYMNNKFVYIEKVMNSRLTTLYQELSYQRCLVERKTLLTLQSIASISPQEFGYAYTESPGVAAVALGEVIHLTYCNPVEVTFRPTDECYNEFPITYLNESFFMAPKTHLIQRHGKEIDCDSILTAQYKVGNDWYSLNKRHQLTPTPYRLSPMTAEPPAYRDLFLATSGIYSYDETLKLRDRLMNPYEREAITNTLVRGYSGDKYNSQGSSISYMFDEKSLIKVRDSVMSKMWGWFQVVGNVSSGVFGCYLVLRFCKFILDTAIHIKALKEIYGFSCILIVGIWDSMTTYFLSKGHKEQVHTDNKLEQCNVPNTGKDEADTVATCPHHDNLSEPLYPTVHIQHSVTRGNIPNKYNYGNA